ncbi:MAG: hypothetical protein KY466_12240, partial [Gemmatimonadetes bacterium]|nr:hypothetical protein [Gemmatimonadota bacterium]
LSVSARTGPLVGAKEMLADDELMVITAAGHAARLTASEIPIQGRATQGKQGIRVAPGDRVVEVSRVASERGGARKGTEAADAAGRDGDDDDQLELVAAAETDGEE